MCEGTRLVLEGTVHKILDTTYLLRTVPCSSCGETACIGTLEKVLEPFDTRHVILTIIDVGPARDEGKHPPQRAHEGLTLGDLSVGERFSFLGGGLIYTVVETHRLGVISKDVGRRRAFMHEADKQVIRA